ncbi:uncharacterized protein LOC135495245 [Lineus longissimus]|uniref:uncharacterized protein LOC135495245 n=1 Tax=Lineus longissimus TaxID=88925 RepID=UPI00315D1D4B
MDKQRLLGPEEERLLTSLVRRKLQSSANKKFLMCKTGGQQMCFNKHIKPRKPTDKVSSPIKRLRSREIEKTRKFVSGGKSLLQLGRELRVKNKISKQLILDHAGLKVAKLERHQQLAMKSTVGLSWRQLRKLKKFFKAIGVKYEGEGAARDLKKSLVGDNIRAEMVFFQVRDDHSSDSIGGYTLRKAPYAYAVSLENLVCDHVDAHLKLGNLRWHGNMPKDEIWLKIGGDKGGDTVKLEFQIANVENPNAAANTIVYCYYEGSDSYTNLQIAFDRFKEDVKNLRLSAWNDKEIRMFLFGDYEFLTKVYGLSGASGRHPCLWCEVSSQEMQTPLGARGHAAKRSKHTLTRDHRRFLNEGKGMIKDAKNYNNVINEKLIGIRLNQVRDQGHAAKRSKHTLTRDHRRFLNEGKGMIKDAKNYNNVINEKLIGIRLNQVCVPYLHILLGVVKKHHEMLEEECHTLDLLIAEDQARHGGLTNEEGLYATYVESVRRLQKLESRISRKKAVLEQYDENTTIGQLAQQTGDKRSLEKRIEKLEKEKTDLQKTAVLHKGTGKVASELDVVLNRHNICRQVYRGKSFIGNHCAHCLKVSPSHYQMDLNFLHSLI